jgi:hypothetical protein
MNSGIWLVEPGRAERRLPCARKGGSVIRYVGISLLLDSVVYYLRLFWTFVAGVLGIGRYSGYLYWRSPEKQSEDLPKSCAKVLGGPCVITTYQSPARLHYCTEST